MSFEIGDRVVLIVGEDDAKTDEGEKRVISRAEVGWVYGHRGPLELVDFGADVDWVLTALDPSARHRR